MLCRRVIFLSCFVLALIFAGNTSAELVARYSFDDYTADDSARYYPASIDANGTFLGDAHVVGDVDRESPVLVLDGDEDYVTVFDSNVADFNTGSFTYAFWAKTSTQASWYYFWKGEQDPCEGLVGVNAYRDNQPQVRFCLYNAVTCLCGGDDDCKARTEVPHTNMVNAGWAHIACVRDATVNELRFYVNGKLAPQGPDGENPVSDCVRGISNSGSLYIGANYRPYSGTGEPSGLFTGRMDDFRVYNEALSQEEIEELFLEVPDANLASNPSPLNYASNVCPDTALSWDAGAKAAEVNGHDVYFGTDFSDVNDANVGEPCGVYIGRQSDVNYNPAGLLEYGKTYYWRIDEVDGVNIWEGEVWRFTVESGKARVPNPGDGAGSVPATKVLSWTPACLATSHDVYFGTDFNDVNEASDPNVLPGRGRQEALETEYDPPSDLIGAVTYYWRIDENGGPAGSKRGDVWSFSVAGGILVHYKFDEMEGDTAYDSSGLERDAGVVGGEEDKWDPDGHDGNCLMFDGDTYVSVPTTVLKNINEGITISVWLNNDSAQASENLIFETGVGDFYLRAEVPDSKGRVYWRAGNDTNDVIGWPGGNPASWVDMWSHFVFIKDANEGEMSIYFNSEQVDSQSDATNTLAGVRNTVFKIGRPVSGGAEYEGKMDDFRVYDYVLSATEVAKLFRGEDIELAWGPKPYNGEVDVPRDANLAWKPGEYAADVNAHQLYFGTDYASVRDANTTVTLGVYKGDQSETAYDLPILDLETTYYWRVDEVNGPCTWPGPVWRFTVADFLPVDDFESYDETNQIRDTWVDYWHQWNEYLPATGAQVDLGVYPYAEVHRGSQSMLYQYKNMGWWQGGYADVCYSEAWLPIPEEQRDWTRKDVKVLRLFFYGDGDNDTNDGERMFVGVEDGDGKYAEVRYGEYNSEEEDMNDLKIEEWQKWDIALQHFSDSNYASVVNDVNLADITTLYIGFGDQRNQVCGGEGIVIFDDIRLNRPICVPEYSPAADFSSDCVVDIADVGVMGAHWLLTDANFGGAIEKPDDANLLGWWKLDEGSGNTAADDSGYGNDGTIEGYYMWVADRNDVNTALRFRKIGGWVIVPDDGSTPELRPQHKVSTCAWVYYSIGQEHSARIVVKGADNRETYAIEVTDEDRTAFYVRDANDRDGDDYEAYDVNGGVWRDDWIHLAGTYDGSSVKCYVNGQLTDSRDDANDPNFLLSQDVNGLAIGNMADANEKAREKEFIGTIDDVRVYDYALSAAEVAWLASDGTGYVGLAVPFNLYNKEPVDQKVINFRDFAMLLEDWLEKKKWP